MVSLKKVQDFVRTPKWYGVILRLTHNIKKQSELPRFFDSQTEYNRALESSYSER